MLATVLHGMQGNSLYLSGEELGMTNVRFEDISQYGISRFSICTKNVCSRDILRVRSGSPSMRKDGTMPARLCSGMAVLMGDLPRGRHGLESPQLQTDQRKGREGES